MLGLYLSLLKFVLPPVRYYDGILVVKFHNKCYTFATVRIIAGNLLTLHFENMLLSDA